MKLSLLKLLSLAALVCLIGCGGGDDDNPADNKDNNSTNNGGNSNNNNNGGNTTGVVDPNTVVKGTFTDDRNSQEYKTVKIGGQTWMAQNLNFETGNNWCYENSPDSCTKYGALYDWETAKTVCPTGWKLPDTADWNKLFKAVGGRRDTTRSFPYWVGAGKPLMSTNGWGGERGDGNGTDKYGFSALPGGRSQPDGNFYSIGSFGYWWIDVEYSANNSSALYQEIHSGDDYVGTYGRDKGYGYSVRCVKQ